MGLAAPAASVSCVARWEHGLLSVQMKNNQCDLCMSYWQGSNLFTWSLWAGTKSCWKRKISISVTSSLHWLTMRLDFANDVQRLPVLFPAGADPPPASVPFPLRSTFHDGSWTEKPTVLSAMTSAAVWPSGRRLSESPQDRCWLSSLTVIGAPLCKSKGWDFHPVTRRYRSPPQYSNTELPVYGYSCSGEMQSIGSQTRKTSEITHNVCGEFWKWWNVTSIAERK